jgi:hypothetical protein
MGWKVCGSNSGGEIEMDEEAKSKKQLKIALLAFVVIEAAAIGILIYKLW